MGWSVASFRSGLRGAGAIAAAVDDSSILADAVSANRTIAVRLLWICIDLMVGSTGAAKAVYGIGRTGGPIEIQKVARSVAG